MRLIRDILAIVVSLVMFSLVPLYGTPFNGCVESGFLTFSIGCSAWPEFLRGFMFIAVIAIIAAHKKYLTAFGLLTILLVVMTGGAVLIGTGEEVAYFQVNYFAISDHIVNPLLLGALAALFVYLAITKIFAFGAARVESA